MNEDIPIEAIIKYIKRDRDLYKAKVETLTAYAHSLEDKLRKTGSREEALQNTIDNLRKQLAIYREEINRTRVSARQSKPYKDLELAFREKSVRAQILEVRLKKMEDIAKRLQRAQEIINEDPVLAEQKKPKRKKFLFF